MIGSLGWYVGDGPPCEIVDRPNPTQPDPTLPPREHTRPQRVEGGMEDDRVEFTLPLESDPQYQLIVSSNRLVQGRWVGDLLGVVW